VTKLVVAQTIEEVIAQTIEMTRDPRSRRKMEIWQGWVTDGRKHTDLLGRYHERMDK